MKRSRLRVDARRWLLSKMLPKAFGDRLNLETKPDDNSDFAELMKLIDGRTRGLPSDDLPLLSEAETE
jgi:hypothetical protein